MNCEICCSKFCFGDESLLWLWFIVIRKNKINKNCNLWWNYTRKLCQENKCLWNWKFDKILFDDGFSLAMQLPMKFYLNTNGIFRFFLNFLVMLWLFKEKNSWNNVISRVFFKNKNNIFYIYKNTSKKI